ncbi:MAG: carboxylating nicotinate-nucleotide diphosphorylase [Anaerolineales bacterium]
MDLADEICRAVRVALEEDIGPGDVTSTAIISASEHLAGEFLVKDSGIIAGLDVVGKVFTQVDKGIVYTPLAEEGSAVSPGDVVARVEGDGPGITIGERTALNFLQRMSGIATATRRYVDAVAGTRARILDTRKTAPGLRALDKLAVRRGSGINHRHGLYDMVLIKDNHILAAGSITEAVERVRGDVGDDLPIEVEVKSLEQLWEALASKVDRVMLDNMNAEQMREAVEVAAGRVELEASGGITLGNVAQVAATGVDYISVGALTHSVEALDVSLDITLVR